MQLPVASLCGALFALGLVLAGMTQPQNILNFLDLFGNWDWRLMLVMCGGIGVNALVYWLWVRKRKTPFFAEKFALPDRNSIDARLTGGAVLFGVGWALAGICPGPALTSLASLRLEPLVFVIAMLAGMWLFRLVQSRL